MLIKFIDLLDQDAKITLGNVLFQTHLEDVVDYFDKLQSFSHKQHQNPKLLTSNCPGAGGRYRKMEEWPCEEGVRIIEKYNKQKERKEEKILTQDRETCL